MTKNLPSGKDANLQIQEVEQLQQNKSKENSCQDILNLKKRKDKNMKAKRKICNSNYTGISI